MTPTEIRQARLALGLTQKEFGDMLHASLKAVQAWEYGKRNITKATEALLKIKMKEKKMTNSPVQLIYIGSDCKLADPGNSKIPDWPVEDQSGIWHRSEFEGQRAAFGQNSVEFGFLARLMSKDEVSDLDMADLPSDVFCADGQYYKSI